MGRQAKTGIAFGAVVVLAVLAFLLVDPIIGIGVLVVGVLLIVLLLRRTATTTRGSKRSRRDSFLEASVDTADAPAASTSAPTLQPWTPPEGLEPWSPPADVVGEPAGTDLVDELAEPSYDGTATDDSWGGSWGDGDTALAEESPLEELDRLDDVDVVAEVERIEAREAGVVVEEEVEVDVEVDEAPASSGLFSVASPIKEDVQSDEEIMAASQATELTVTDDNSELAKLLAKVQARLAAYE